MKFIIIYIIAHVVLILVLLYAFLRLFFLRNPRRKIPKGSNIVSPADGNVISIIDTKKITKGLYKIKKGLKGEINLLVKDITNDGYIVQIMLSLLDVHYQRSPVEGKIISTKHIRGKFLSAMRKPETFRAIQNEKNEIVLENKNLGKIKIVQIAGILARRINCYVKKNQNIKKGQLIGLINLGSQVILVLPKKNIKLKIRKGQHVYAGKTVIADIIKT